jgi:hypothetical protein
MSHTVDPFIIVAYTGDDGVNYGIKMRSSVATAMGYSPITTAVAKWPFKHHMCRHIRAKNIAAPYNEISVVALTVGQDEFKQATLQTITWRDGATYKCIGAIGERRDRNNR